LHPSKRILDEFPDVIAIPGTVPPHERWEVKEMWSWFALTPQELAAKKLRRRRWDKVHVKTVIAALSGAGAGAITMFQIVDTSSRREMAVITLIGALCGYISLGAIARTTRTDDMHLLAYPLMCGVIFWGVALAADEGARPAIAAASESSASTPSGTTISGRGGTETSVVAALPPVPGGSGVATAEGSTDMLPASTVSCSVMIWEAAVAPGPACGSRVSVEEFGDPTTGPSAWMLGDHASVSLQPPGTGRSWLVAIAGDGPPTACVTEAAAVLEDDSTEPIDWMEQARVLELVEAPIGTEVILWADCSADSNGVGIDDRSGWIVTVQ
jgi:hypothetical protein